MPELRDVSDPAGALASDAVKALAALLRERPGWTHEVDGGRHVIRDELGILAASNDDLATATETARLAHKVIPAPGSAARTKPGFTGAPADLSDARHYPVTAICGCGEIVRSEHIQAGWAHTGRKPGDPR